MSDDSENTEVREEQPADLSGSLEQEDVSVTEAAAGLAAMDDEDEQQAALDEQILNNTVQNVTLADAEMKMFGDRTVLAQVAQIVAYIRHALKSGEKTVISVVVNGSDQTAADAEFMFDLNGCAVPDLVPQPEAFVN